MMNMTDMVKHLLIINIIFFVGSFMVPNSSELLALHYFESDKFRVWQPITHMFMHGGLMHIFFNMFALVSFGSALEQFWGGKKFLFFYLSCGIGSMLLHSLVTYWELNTILNEFSNLNISRVDLFTMLNSDMQSGKTFQSNLLYENAKELFDKYPFTQESFTSFFEAACVNQSTAVGASGAIYGLLVAFAFMFPNAELALMFIPMPIKAKYFVPGILLVDLFLGLKGDSLFGSGGTGVAHFAHLGGALCGFLMMWYWKKNQFNNNRWDR